VLANWVKEVVSGPPGTGTISLGGAAAGHIAFSDAFSSGDLVYYAIEDGNNREAGIGTLTSGTPWTLARTVILETLDAGVFTRNPATGLNLTSAAVVMCSAISETSTGTYPTINSLAGKRVTIQRLGQSTAANTTANRLEYSVYQHRAASPVTGISIYIYAAAITGTKARVGIYQFGSDGKPGNLIVESTDLNTTTTGWKTYTLASPLHLQPGWYWLALVADGDPKMVHALQSQYMTDTPVGMGDYKGATGLFQTLASGWISLPNPAAPTGALTYHGVFPPYIEVQ